MRNHPLGDEVTRGEVIEGEIIESKMVRVFDSSTLITQSK